MVSVRTHPANAGFFYAFIFFYTKFVDLHKVCKFTIVIKKQLYEKTNTIFKPAAKCSR